MGCDILHNIMSPITSLQKLAANLKRVRHDKHMTQVEVAEKAGLSTNYYARVERGDVNPTFETLEKLTKALSIASSDILPF